MSDWSQQPKEEINKQHLIDMDGDKLPMGHLLDFLLSIRVICCDMFHHQMMSDDSLFIQFPPPWKLLRANHRNSVSVNNHCLNGSKLCGLIIAIINILRGIRSILRMVNV